MPINAVPERSNVVQGEKVLLPEMSWLEWFKSVFAGLFGWRRSYYVTKVHNFGSINAQSEATTTVTLNGVRSGDVVLVRPTTAVNGIAIDGTVTANNEVTIRAFNYSSGAIDPSEQTYRVIVFQQ